MKEKRVAAKKTVLLRSSDCVKSLTMVVGLV
jgi:hypothetical protein